MSASHQPSIFLSHTWVDKPFVRSLASHLRKAGAHVWLDEAEILLGESLIEKIRNGIDSVDFLGVVLSPDAVKSRWVQIEVDVAMNQEIKGKKIKVLPLLYRSCELPWFLEGKLYADFTKPSLYGKALQQIYMRLGLMPPSTLFEEDKMNNIDILPHGLFGAWLPQRIIDGLDDLRGRLTTLLESKQDQRLYQSIIICYNATTSSLRDHFDDAPNNIDLQFQITSDVSHFCHEMNHCILERFQDGNPLWEGIAQKLELPLQIFFKILITTESMLNGILEITHRALHASLNEQGDINCQRFAVCLQLTQTIECFLATCPMLLRVGFIRVSPYMLINTDARVILLHEAGHVLWQRLWLNLKEHFLKSICSNVSACVLILEVLCDYFALSLGYAGDVDLMESSHISLIASMDNMRANAAKSIFMFRRAVSSMLFTACRTGRTIEELGRVLEDQKSHEWNEYAATIDSIQKLCRKSPVFITAIETISHLAERQDVIRLIEDYEKEILKLKDNVGDWC